MKQRTTASHIPGSSPVRSLFPIRPLATRSAALTAGLAAAALLAYGTIARAQATDTQTTGAQSAPQATAPADTSKKKPSKDEKVVKSKDTRLADKKASKENPLLGKDAKLPDKTLYDKAEDAIKHGKFDVGRLDLQTLLNTYPDSQFMMRAKLAIADSWYHEGGTAALTQAEQEYKDFITFFPNAPEAAEAQMRIGDIYFKQMDKPDRDYTNITMAEGAYRLMLQQFPESVLIPQARQKLREVQEVLGQREASVGAFYATHTNWAATIARYQTVVDTYPLYSHLDEVLIGLGDAYFAEAQAVRANMKAVPGATPQQQEMVETAKAHLLKIYEGQAASAYDKVVLEHSAAAHVEDAKDRLVTMGRPVPTPTPEQVAASEALESSRGQYTLSKRATLMFLHQADTVQAATIGVPPIEDPKPVSAASVVRQTSADYVASMNPSSGNAPPKVTAAAPESTPDAGPAAPPSLQDVPSANAGTRVSETGVGTASPSAPASTSGSHVGLEIVQPGANSPTPGSTTFPGTEAAPAATPPAQPATPAPATNGGIGPVGPANTTLAPVEKPSAAPSPINEAAGTKQPAAQLPPANGKKPKPDINKQDDSSSKHKKKKGLGKLNPF